MRGLLAPLSRLAGKYDVAIVCVSHLNKSAGASVIYRTMGSLAFVAAVRSAWCVLKDKDDPLHRLMLPIKVNLCREPTGMAYTVVPAPMDPSVGMVRWEPEPITGVDVDEALAPDRGRKPSAVEASGDWLEEQLAGGPLPSREIERRARDAGYSWASCRRGQYSIGIRSRKASFGDGWVWELPPRRRSDLHTPPNEHLRLTGLESEGAQTGECEGLSAFVAPPPPPPKALKVPPTVERLRVAGQKAEDVQTAECKSLSAFAVPDESDRIEREAIQTVESAEAMWAELATMPPNVLKDRASRTDDPETKRRLLALAQRRYVVVQAGVNDEDGDRREAGFSRKS